MPETQAPQAQLDEAKKEKETAPKKDRVAGVANRCCLSIGSRFGRQQHSDDDNGNHRE